MRTILHREINSCHKTHESWQWLKVKHWKTEKSALGAHTIGEPDAAPRTRAALPPLRRRALRTECADQRIDTRSRRAAARSHCRVRNTRRPRGPAHSAALRGARAARPDWSSPQVGAQRWPTAAGQTAGSTAHAAPARSHRSATRRARAPRGECRDVRCARLAHARKWAPAPIKEKN